MTMPDEPENHTIRLLRELRDEMRVEFAMVGKRFEKMDARFDEMDRRFDAVNLRIDGVTNILTLLAGQSRDHEERIAKLESDT
jgi:hypothetical protein